MSFAQNLFFLATMLTPILDPEGVMWTPKPALQLLPLALYTMSIFLAPFLVGTHMFVPIVFIIRLLLFCPLLLPLVIPRSFKNSHFRRKHVHRAYQGAYKFIVVSSAALVVIQTILAIKDNLFHSPRHLVTGQDPITSQRRAGVTTAIARVLEAVNDNPAVSALGYDYVLSVISFLTWYSMK